MTIDDCRVDEVDAPAQDFEDCFLQKTIGLVIGVPKVRAKTDGRKSQFESRSKVVVVEFGESALKSVRPLSGRKAGNQFSPLGQTSQPTFVEAARRSIITNGQRQNGRLPLFPPHQPKELGEEEKRCAAGDVVLGNIEPVVAVIDGQ